MPLVAVTDAGETTQIVTALPVRAPEVAYREAPASQRSRGNCDASGGADAAYREHHALLGLAGLVSLTLFALLGLIPAAAVPARSNPDPPSAVVGSMDHGA